MMVSVEAHFLTERGCVSAGSPLSSDECSNFPLELRV